MTPEELAADRAVCDAAPSGPYEIFGNTVYFYVDGRPDSWHAFPGDVPLATFIAAARTRWPIALDRIEQLERELLDAKLAGVDLMNQCRQLREQVAGHAERIAAQSELLSRRAEKCPG